MSIAPYMYILYIWDFGHQNGSMFELEHFLLPFFKTRSHDGYARTFRSSHQFLEVPQKGV